MVYHSTDDHLTSEVDRERFGRPTPESLRRRAAVLARKAATLAEQGHRGTHLTEEALGLMREADRLAEVLAAGEGG